ncbi:MAG: hypothetical protein FJW36_11130 [Acidobacteria bacterium]|nr:hypothetical protein [Acidobacteriota bacterium]
MSALAFLGLLLGLTLYSRWRANALFEENAYGEAMGVDRESFSDYYRPMTRILDPREMEACSSLSGLKPSDIARFRTDRIAAFRTYLNEVRLDFNRIEFKLRYIMLAASQNEAELVSRLNQVKTNFQLQLIRVEFQLVLFRLGWAGVDVEPLVQMLEQLEACLLLRPSTSAAAA